jgi:hypothetical protein
VLGVVFGVWLGGCLFFFFFVFFPFLLIIPVGVFGCFYLIRVFAGCGGASPIQTSFVGWHFFLQTRIEKVRPNGS